MNIEAEVKKLSKAEQVNLFKSLVVDEVLSKELIEQLLEELDVKDMSRINKLIDKHFEEYDEVFKALA